MKKLGQERIRFILENGYGPALGGNDMLYQFRYNELPDEEKPKYEYYDKCRMYYKKSDVPQFTESQMKEIAMLTVDEKLSKIESNTKTIKNCVLIFTILMCISVLGMVFTWVSLL